MIEKDTGRGPMAVVDTTPIPTPKGFVLAQDLKPGDYVFDPQGRPSPVLGVQSYISPECYELHFADGTRISGDRHMAFMLQNDEYRRKQMRWFAGRHSKFAKRFRKQMDRLTVAELYSRGLRNKRGRSEYALTNTKPLQYPQTNLPVPPYVLGLWLGSLSPTGRHWLGKKDFNQMQRKVRQVGFSLVRQKSQSGGKWEFFFRPGVRESFTFANALIPTVVPQSYLEADVDSRFLLLEGLIDSHNAQKCSVSDKMFVITDTWLSIRRKQQLIEGLGMGTRLIKKKENTRFNLYFSLPNENKAVMRRFLRKIEKISAKKCVHIETEHGFVAEEGFLAVC